MSGSRFGPLRILYIEDDDNDAMLFQRAVANCSRCAVTRLADAHSAIVTLEKIVNPAEKAPHLILTDLKMPGMSGLEFIGWLRTSRFACLPVILFTASALPLDVNTAYRCGANSFVTKPSDFAALQTCVATIVNYWVDICALPQNAAALAETASAAIG